MDLNRSSHINSANEVVGAEVLPNPTDKQIHQLPENGETKKIDESCFFKWNIC